MFRTRAFVLLALLLASSPLAAAQIAMAQAPAADDPPVARSGQEDPEARPAAEQPPLESLLEDARQAAAAGRHHDAATLLRRALEREPSPAIAFNLTLVLRDAGEVVEAIEIVDNLLAGSWGELPEDRRARAEEISRELRAMTATVIVRASGAPRVRLTLDGEAIAAALEGSTLRLQLNPGRHELTAEADGMREQQRDIDARAGESSSVTLEMEPVGATGILPSPTEDPTSPRNAIDDGGDGGGSRVWLWVGIAGAVLAAGAIAVAIGLATSGGSTGPEPLPEDYLGRVETLRLP